MLSYGFVSYTSSVGPFPPVSVTRGNLKNDSFVFVAAHTADWLLWWFCMSCLDWVVSRRSYITDSPIEGKA